MNLRRIHQLVAAAVVFCVSAVAQAGVIFGLQLDDATTFRTVNSGDSVFLDLTLSDTDGNTLFPSGGLLSAGGRLLQATGSIVMGLTSVTDVDALWGAGTFSVDPASAGGPMEIGKVLGTTDLLSGPPVGLVQGPSTIRIARFAYTVTGAAGARATIVSDVLGGGFDGIVTFDSLDVLDGSLTGFGAVNLTIAGAAVVPEPSSVILLCVGAAVAGAGRCLRRRMIFQSPAEQ